MSINLRSYQLHQLFYTRFLTCMTLQQVASYSLWYLILTLQGGTMTPSMGWWVLRYHLWKFIHVLTPGVLATIAPECHMALITVTPGYFLGTPVFTVAMVSWLKLTTNNVL